MGILDGYQFDPSSFQPGGLLGQILGMQQQVPAQAPSGFPMPAQQQPLTDVSAAQRVPTDSLLGGPPPMAAPQPQAPQQAPQGLGMGDRAMAALGNFANASGPLPAIFGAISGGLTGQRTDPLGMMLQQQAATAQALVPVLQANGIPQPQAIALARAAALNPEVLKALAPQLASKGQFITTTGMLGDQHINLANPFNGSVRDVTPNGAPAESSSGVPTSLEGSLSQIQQMRAAGATPDQMLAVAPKSIQPFLQGLIEGRALPADLGMKSQARGAIMQFAQAMGMDEGQIKARMQFAQDIGNTKSGLGFRLEAGQKMLNHMEELSRDALAMNNKDVPGGIAGYIVPGSVIQGVNAVGNNTPEQRTAASRMATTAGSYAQEKGKFLSGVSGGTGAEREKTVNDYNPNLPRSNLSGTLQGDMDLFKGQFGAMTERRDQMVGPNTGTRKFEVVTPAMEAQMERIQKNIDRLRAGEPGERASQQPQQQSAPAVPPPAERKIGQTYPTPKGPAIWRGTGWEPVR